MIIVVFPCVLLKLLEQEQCPQDITSGLRYWGENTQKKGKEQNRRTLRLKDIL